MDSPALAADLATAETRRRPLSPPTIAAGWSELAEGAAASERLGEAVRAL